MVVIWKLVQPPGPVQDAVPAVRYEPATNLDWTYPDEDRCDRYVCNRADPHDGTPSLPHVAFIRENPVYAWTDA